MTSFLPSTMMSESELCTFGPHVSPWKLVAVPTVSTERTSSTTVLLAASPELTSARSNSFARSTTAVRLVARTSEISTTEIFA